MWKRKLLLGALVSASIGAISLPAAAASSIYVDIAPPAPRYEVVPAPRAGYIWVPGFWDYDSHRHVWRKGHWERERAGYTWHPNRWEEHNGKWSLERGRWEHEHMARRDSDHDGVPDRYDNHPDNPYRR